MNKQEMNQIVLEILREEKRSGQVINAAEVLNHIPDIMSSVDIDRKYLQNSIREILYSNTKHPLNAIMGLIGLQVIRKEDALDIIEPKRGNSENKLNSLLKIDEKVLKGAISSMTSNLASFENEANNDRLRKTEKINELVTKLDEKEREIAQLRADSNAQFKAVAVRIQCMLSLYGPPMSDVKPEQDLYELLTDLEIDVFWSADGAPLSAAVMFTALKTDDVAQHKTKPCLLYKGEVVAKGLLFVEE